MEKGRKGVGKEESRGVGDKKREKGVGGWRGDEGE